MIIVTKFAYPKKNYNNFFFLSIKHKTIKTNHQSLNISSYIFITSGNSKLSGYYAKLDVSYIDLK